MKSTNIIQLFQSRNTAMFSALGMVLMVQTPHTIKLVSELSQYGYWGALYEGVVASLFVELAVVYFALNGKKWQTAIAMIGMSVINYGYYKESVLAGDPVAIMLMLTIPVLVWQITEVAGAEPAQTTADQDQPVKQTKVNQPEPVTVRRSLTLDDKIKEMLSTSDFSERVIANKLHTNKSRVHRVKRKNGFKVLEYNGGFNTLEK